MSVLANVAAVVGPVLLFFAAKAWFDERRRVSRLLAEQRRAYNARLDDQT